MPTGTIEVFLIGAIGIKDTEFFGKADPYAVLTCGKQKLRSNTASNQGSKPIWNQKFSFFVDDSVTELHIRIFNHNILTEDDELGHTVVPLAKVFADSKLATTSYSLLRPSGRNQGEVKLSISFAPKVKAAAVGNSPAVAGPYNAQVYGSPYAPEPLVKHDPLVGPDGYHRTDSSSKHDSESLRPHHHGECLHLHRHNESKHPLPYLDTSTSYARADSHAGLPHGQVYPSAPFDSEGDAYQKPPRYGHSSIPPASSFHGAVPAASAGSVYPPPGPSVHSKPPSQCGPGCDELSESFTGLNMYGQPPDSGSHGYYKKQDYTNDPPTGSYPPTESSSYGRYPGYPPNPSIARPPAGYPPVGDPGTGYPPYSSNQGYPGSAYPTGPYPSSISAPLYGGPDSGSQFDSPYPPAPPHNGSQSGSYRGGYPK